MPRSKVLSLLLAATAALPAVAQVSVSAPSGIDVQMTARLEPGSVPVPSAVRTAGAGRFHRIVLDSSQRRYFPYDVVVEPKDGSAALQVRLEPSSLSAAELTEMQVDPSWIPVPLRTYPLVPDVRPGDTVTIDLLKNSTTGQTVVDHLAFKGSNSAAASEPGPLRNLSLADVEMHLEDFRLSSNGAQVDAAARLGGSISGGALWFYLPGRGRFIVSLLPNPHLGFRPGGEVANRSLTFTDGRDRYDIQSSRRIVPAGGRFNLYVLHDPMWQPAVDEFRAPLLVGAAGRAEWLVAQ